MSFQLTIVLVACASLPFAEAQLRPRRVGVGAFGDATLQAEVGDVDAPGKPASDTLGDPAELMSALMKDNPMLQGLAQGNPEIAELINDPTKMQQQMTQMAQLFSSNEGKAAIGEVQDAMREFLTDPAKMREGIEAIKSNPMLKTLTDRLPEEVKQVVCVRMARSEGRMRAG